MPMYPKLLKSRKRSERGRAWQWRFAIVVSFGGGRRVVIHDCRAVFRCAQLLPGQREESVKRPPTRARINNKV